ncbi:hypothetical protein [Pelagibius sp. Alg239-R121]|uniref:hypothetical protein n=1 Tax=Pelagibius sp. Alg239-R121 TaxID=2993448 RepID=UPI0024A60D69|nr:hypothetical protein [Pelagibius sp. Alg239-R121]
MKPIGAFIFSWVFSFLCSFAVAETQDYCAFGKNNFTSEHCLALGTLEWTPLNSEQIYIELFSSDRDIVTCDHYGALIDQYNAVLKGLEVNSATNSEVNDKALKKTVDRISSFPLDLFFSRPQYLRIRFLHFRLDVRDSHRIAVFFQGNLNEQSAAELLDDNGSLSILLTTGSGELCFESGVFIVIYEDYRELGSVLLYRDLRPLAAVTVDPGLLEAQLKRSSLYRNRWTDID